METKINKAKLSETDVITKLADITLNHKRIVKKSHEFSTPCELFIARLEESYSTHLYLTDAIVELAV
ncbi:TPA: hypothetical protein GRI87_00105 [Vibrio parahaemolyticus]|nr:hypothetical protein [Vibrio parahaemolyticus]EHZ2722628.1 hypothetical protein [Vibrio parahaemolyticus]EIV1595357.1 hypothetical protein [Vibrio parahaemolyticus]HAS6726979.1 hypothetical protein [Vibrio parahaemolyticus]